MKKYLLSLSVIVAFAFYALLSSTRSNTVTQQPAVATSGTDGTQNGQTPSTTSAGFETTNPNGSTAPVTNPATTPAKTPVVVATGKYKDGTYTSPVEDAYYGKVQISATVSGGKLTAVNFLQYPNESGTSKVKSAHAMPILISEAIKSQASKVDVVSGATATSGGFNQALADVTSQALN